MKRHLLRWLAAAAIYAPLAASAGFSNMFVFGDSLSDNGNLFGWTGAPNPVTGVTPIPLSPPYFPGRFQDGKSYAELVWSGLQSSGQLQATGDLSARGLKPGFQPAIDTGAPAGTNYAVGGARSRYHVFDVGAGLPPVGVAPGAAPFAQFSLLGQFGQYQADYLGAVDPNALYLVWAGSNDIGDALRLGAINPLDAQTRVQEALSDFGQVLGGLVAGGARNLLIPNVPDLGLVPELNASPAVSAAATALSSAYNAALATILANLFIVDPTIKIFDYDSFGMLRQAVSSPASFGLTNVSTPCLSGLFVAPPPTGTVTVCSNPEEHLFWDIIHPTARTHEILAQGMLAEIPEPASVLLVGMGIAALGLATGLRRRRPAVPAA